MATAPQKILVVCSLTRDVRELLLLPNQKNYDFIFHDSKSTSLQQLVCEEGKKQDKAADILRTIDDLITTYQNESLAGVISSDDYPGITIASIVAKALKLPGPDPESVLLCQHKYYSRVAQQKYVPNAVPNFSLLDPQAMSENINPPLPFPFFIKPVKSFFSCFAKPILSLEEFHSSTNEFPSLKFLKPFNELLKKHTKLKYNSNYFIAEELLEGHQGTIEGFAFKGDFGFFGIVDSIMYPGTMSFERFVYPSSLPQNIQERMATIAEECMRGIGFDNGLFNIEFFYNPRNDTLKIIEINPRIASQFADLYEKVDGINSYEALVAIATGKKPTIKKRQGPFKLAASCVLREFENKLVLNVPDKETMQKMQEKFPSTRFEIFAHKGKRLSSELQDGQSYRYCLIHLGANNPQDLQNKLSKCIKELNFQFVKP